MFTAKEANKITSLNKYKIDFKNQLTLNYILNQIKQAAKEGRSSIELDTSKNSSYIDYYSYLEELNYRVRYTRSKMYIRW